MGFIGFAQNDFNVVGYDVNPFVKEIFKLNNIGIVKIKDLTLGFEDEFESPLILIGGPPCKPWSSVNVTRRTEKHPDYSLLESFFKSIAKSTVSTFSSKRA